MTWNGNVEEIKKSGLIIGEKGFVECPVCGSGLRFNGGSTAVFHKRTCTSGLPNPTYLSYRLIAPVSEK